MFASSPVRTACLLLGMLAASLTAAWGEAPSPGKPLVVPAATVTITVNPYNNPPEAQVGAAIQFLEGRGEADMAGRVRAMAAEGRLVASSPGKADGQRIHLDSSGPRPDQGTPAATAQAFRLAVTLTHLIAGEDPSIFDRWGNLVHAVKWVDDIKAERLKISENNSPLPRDRKAWAQAISEMASFTETFFTRDSRAEDWRPFPTEAEFHKWCSGVRRQAADVGARTSAGGNGPAHGIERGTVGGGEGPAGPAGSESGPGSPKMGTGGSQGAGAGAGGAGGPAGGPPIP